MEKAEKESKISKEIAEHEKKEREIMEKRLNEVNAGNSRVSIFKKIGFGVLSGVCFLAAPFNSGRSIEMGIDFAKKAAGKDK